MIFNMGSLSSQSFHDLQIIGFFSNFSIVFQLFYLDSKQNTVVSICEELYCDALKHTFYHDEVLLQGFTAISKILSMYCVSRNEGFEFDMGTFKNHVDKEGWVGGLPNVHGCPLRVGRWSLLCPR